MTLPAYKLPVYDTETLDVTEIPFSGVCPAGKVLTLVAGSIPYPFKIIKVTFAFADTARWNVQYYLLVSMNQNAPANQIPPDDNVFAKYSPNGYFVGNNMIREPIALYTVSAAKAYIKFCANNLGAIDVPVHASVTIQRVGS